MSMTETAAAATACCSDSELAPCYTINTTTTAVLVHGPSLTTVPIYTSPLDTLRVLRTRCWTRHGGRPHQCTPHHLVNLSLFSPTDHLPPPLSHPLTPTFPLPSLFLLICGCCRICCRSFGCCCTCCRSFCNCCFRCRSLGGCCICCSCRGSGCCAWEG